MSDYERAQVRIVYSAASDYSKPEFDTQSQQTTATPTYCPRCGLMKIGTSATTIMAADEFGTSVDTFFIKNNGAYSVTIGYDDAASTAQAVVVQSGEMCLIQNINVDTALTGTAATAACECFVYLSGT